MQALIHAVTRISPFTPGAWNDAAGGFSTTSLLGTRGGKGVNDDEPRQRDRGGASHHSVDDTVAKLQALLEAKNVWLFAVIDHSGEAAKVGLRMHPTKLLIFGNRKAGTPLMLAAPSVAIDLPLKILVWEDDQGRSGSLTTARST